MKKFLLIIPALTPLYLFKTNLLGLPTNVFEILTVLAIIVNLSQWKKIELRKFWQKNKLLCIGVLLIIFGLIASLLANKTYLVSLGILKSWFLIPIIFSFVLYSAIEKREDVSFILKGVYLSTFIAASIGLTYKALGIVTYDGRLQSFYNSPNYLAMFLAPGIFLALYLIKSEFKHKYAYSISLALIILSLYFTYSYATWVAVALSLFIVVFLNYKNKFKVSLILLFLFLSLIVSQFHSPKFADILQDNPRSSLASRMMIWQSSTKMIRDYPILGIGAGNFQKKYLEYQKYFPPYLEWAVPHPHNLFLAFWLQAGIMGLIGLFLIYFAIFKNLRLLILNKKNVAMATTLFGIFSYIIFHGMFDTTYWKNDLSFIFWIMSFLTIRLKAFKNQDDK